MFKPTVSVLRGDPRRFFSSNSRRRLDENLRRLKQLGQVIGDSAFLGQKRRQMGRRGRVLDPNCRPASPKCAPRAQHHDVDEGEGKPISFVEDCAVPLEHCPTTRRDSRRLRSNGTRGTCMACGVGCCMCGRYQSAAHKDVRAMRAIARSLAMVREYIRLAFRRTWRRHRALGIPRFMFGAELVHAFEESRPLRSARRLQSRQDRARAEIDDRSNFRYGRITREDIATALDWSAYPARVAVSGRVEMCNTTALARARRRLMCQAIASPATSAT